MRKIDKTNVLSSKYKTWNDKLEEEALNHPKYNSSAGEFYGDIVMNLFYCQGGLCAYSEIKLCPEELYDAKYWVNGRYNNENRCEFFGQLDHFDESLKSKKEDLTGRKDWLWDNFFMILSDLNTKVKGAKPVDYILKPDAEDYDEFRLLDYNSSTHLFVANTNLPDEMQARINHMILVLGINYGPVKDKRRCMLNDIFGRIDIGILDWTYKPDEFPTAYEICKRSKVAKEAMV